MRSINLYSSNIAFTTAVTFDNLREQRGRRVQLSLLLVVRLTFVFAAMCVERSPLLALRLTPILSHNAANNFGITQGGDRRPSRPLAKPLVRTYADFRFHFILFFVAHVRLAVAFVWCTRAPLRGRQTLPASRAHGRIP